MSATAIESGAKKKAEGIVLWSQEDYTHPFQGRVMAVYKIKFLDFPREMFDR